MYYFAAASLTLPMLLTGRVLAGNADLLVLAGLYVVGKRLRDTHVVVFLHSEEYGLRPN